MEFRWESDRNYRKLYYVQTSTRTRERSEYFLVLRPKDRKTAILKLTITIPDYFNAKIRPNKLKLCKMKKGGMLSRSRCEEVIPAVFEVSENQTAIEVFPETPIPTEDTYAVSMTIFICSPASSAHIDIRLISLWTFITSSRIVLKYLPWSMSSSTMPLDGRSKVSAWSAS